MYDVDLSRIKNVCVGEMLLLNLVHPGKQIEQAFTRYAYKAAQSLHLNKSAINNLSSAIYHIHIYTLGESQNEKWQSGRTSFSWLSTSI